MCGIVGIMNGATSRQANFSYPKLLEQAIQCNSLRGEDSTGVMQLDKKKLYIHRKAVAGWNFVADDKASGFLRDADTSWLTLAHNRAATAGLKTDEQAHPFTIQRDDGTLLMGVHNGTLVGWDSVNYGVDSEWALALIAAKGDDAFAEFNGAFTFVWYDEAEPKVLNMIRNTERPMYVAYIKDSTRAVFGSEPDMLTWLCRRNSVILERDILELTPGRRYKFEIDNPRRFTSAPVAQYSAHAATWSYPRISGFRENNKYTKDGWINGMLAVLSKKDTPTTGPAIEVGKVKVRMKVQTTVAEERLARTCGLLDLEGAFLGDVYDAESKTLWGEIEVDGGSNAAVMRGVSPAFNKYVQRAGVVVVKIIGAFAQPSRVGVAEMAMVVRQATAKGRADEIADAVSDEIDSIRRNAALN